MSGRAAGLVLLVLLELIAGIGLRNAALGVRARAEACRRRVIEGRCREQELRAVIALYLSPAARLDRAAARERSLQLTEPEL